MNQTEADRYFLRVALAVRYTTDDPKGKIVLQSAVGAVVARRDGEISRSANVLPPMLRERYMAEGREIGDADRYHVIEHAERAALFEALLAHAELSAATIYCTRFPCSDCARAIVWSGIKRAVFLNGIAGEERWRDSQRAARQILKDGGVTIRYLAVDIE